MSDDYAKRQAQKDREYAEYYKTPDYKRYVESLTPEERRRLEAEGLLAPMLPKDGVANGCGIEDDAAESPGASVEAPRVSASDSLDAIIADYPHLEAAIEERARKMNGGGNGGEMLRKLALLFIDQGRRALNADCLAFVSGIAVRMGESGMSLARKHGISRQAFHKRCGELMKQLGLPPSRAMKIKHASREYRIANRRWASARIGTDTTKTLTPTRQA